MRRIFYGMCSIRSGCWDPDSLKLLLDQIFGHCLFDLPEKLIYTKLQNLMMALLFQMTAYPSHFTQSLGNHGAMAYLKASPTYHMNGLSALGMSHGLDSLQSQSLQYGGGNIWYFYDDKI